MPDETEASQDDQPTVAATIAATAKPILEIGRAWMMDPATGERAAELGLPPGFAFWVIGRAGAMGDVDPDVAAAAIGFMAPGQVKDAWATRPASVTPHEVAAAYAAAAAAWGERVLAALDDEELAELASLANRVAAAALPSVGPLFAGWRSLPRPTDPAGAATVALNVLREHRGCAHLTAANAVGLGPHGAIMSTDDPVRGGAPWAERFGWSAPHPEPDGDRRAEAERLTSEICAPAYEALDAGERARFVELVAAARAAIDA